MSVAHVCAPKLFFGEQIQLDTELYRSVDCLAPHELETVVVVGAIESVVTMVAVVSATAVVVLSAVVATDSDTVVVVVSAAVVVAPSALAVVAVVSGNLVVVLSTAVVSTAVVVVDVLASVEAHALSFASVPGTHAHCDTSFAAAPSRNATTFAAAFFTLSSHPAQMHGQFFGLNRQAPHAIGLLTFVTATARSA